ncbi:MAG: ABC transporter permease [Ruminococcus sp.]|nr:ABC transporter permease [Ruminococcus sp.]MCM1479522.1 ABC transporter permease [Muribaculaceae bacterium]
MNLLENIKLALTSLKSNKMRAVLTMLGIIIGISSIIMITTLGNIMQKSITDTINSQGGSNLVGFQLATKPDATRDYIMTDDFITEEMISNVDERFSEEIKGTVINYDTNSAKTRFRHEDLDLVVYSVSPGYIYQSSYEMVAGRYITDKDVTRMLNVCVISDKQAEKLYGSVKGAIGQVLNIKMLEGSYDFTVVGIYEYKMTAMMSAMVNTMGEDWNNEVYVPYTTVAKINNDPDPCFYYYYVIVNDEVDPTKFCEEVTDYMNSRFYRSNDSVEIMYATMESQMEMINQVLGIVSMVIAIIAGVSLVVGGIGVMNIMLVSVTERTREIGVRKALGAPNSAIRSQFIIESVIICLIGGIIGIIGGILLGNVAGIIVGTVAPPSVGAIILAVSFSMAIGVFFGYYPANRAAKLDPIEALRYE